MAPWLKGFRRKTQAANAEPQKPLTIRHNKSTGEIPKIPEQTEDEESQQTEAGQESKGKNPLGLTLVHNPEESPSCDLIFVHGLGGTSQESWSWEHNTEYFWPGKWLSRDAVVSSARIFTFGYDANFKSSVGVVSGINDFARDLLFCLKVPKVDENSSIEFGKRPIVFVCHSMGGLVVKKACIIGENNPQYESIVSCISAILFLAVPHRGSDYAATLNSVLAVTLRSSKRYVKEISQNSDALEELNELFRHWASKTKIFSFYETQVTKPLQSLVVEKDSSMLGYPGEISTPLHANHHTVCKYQSQEDENYRSVRNTLQNLVQEIKKSDNDITSKQTAETIVYVKDFLGLREEHLPEEDHSFFSTRRSEGTGQWILEEAVFKNWLQGYSKSGILWLNLAPGTGKSVLMSFVIDHLRDNGFCEQSFYFRYGDNIKRSSATLLKNIAFQLAQQIPKYLQALQGFLELQNDFSSIESRTLWQKLFVSTLFKLELEDPIYWIIDGLDESEAPSALLELFSNITISKTPIRILISGRPTSPLLQGFGRLSKTHAVEKISEVDTSKDVEVHVLKELEFMDWPDSLKEEILQNLLSRWEGSFLWVQLALEEIMKCHTPEAIYEALEDIPPGMEQLYQTMEHNLLKNLRKNDIPLAKSILSWVVCPRYPLQVNQLVEALHSNFSTLLDPKNAIARLCGQFALIDRKQRVVILHQTAREYLTRNSESELYLNPEEVHIQHANKCLATLLEQFGSGTAHEIREDSFLFYAIFSWPHHVRAAREPVDETYDKLVAFLGGHFILDWIYWLAKFRNMKVMVEASHALSHFVRRRKKLDSERSPLLHRLNDEEVLNDWATDLIRFVGKFGRDVILDPSTIYHLIPPFAPRTSALYRQFAENTNQKVQISGVTMETWDDKVARISVGSGAQGRKIQSTLDSFATATSKGEVILWDATSFEDTQRLTHGEHILSMEFSREEDKIVTAGSRTTCVWDVASGEMLHSIANISGVKTIAITFLEDDNRIMIGCADSGIRVVDLSKEKHEWELITTIHHNHSTTAANYAPAPRSMAFNTNGSQVAISYRAAPLGVWEVWNSKTVGKCIRRRGDDRKKSNHQPWTAVDRIVWHPSSGHVLGIYLDGSILKWHPFRDEYQEISAVAAEIQCSPEGSLFITSDNDCCIKLYNFAHFSLIYQLNGEDMIHGLSINPDCSRFYDIRGSSCNVWEPNVLTRLSEGEEKDSDTKSITSSTSGTLMVSEAEMESRPLISALAPMNKDTKVAVGDEEGKVYLYDYTKNVAVDLWQSTSFVEAEVLAWSDDDRYLLAADLYGKISASEVLNVSTDKVELRTLFSKTTGEQTGGLVQLLFNPGNNLLLVVGRESSLLWSISSDGSTSAICEKPARGKVRKFINNPENSSQLLGFYGAEILVCVWEDFSLVIRLSLDAAVPNSISSPASGGERPNLVRDNSVSQAMIVAAEQSMKSLRILLSENRSHVAVHTSFLQGGKLRKLTRVIPTSSFAGPPGGSTLSTETQISCIDIPQEVFNNIEVPVGIIGKNRFVFVDAEFWVCTWDMNAQGQEQPRRHFFLPKDWIGSEELRMCCFGKDAAFLYPKNGEVAVIHSDMN